ncbi:MAG: DUF4124 domain-containing protein [Methylophilaceae bacterium]
MNKLLWIMLSTLALLPMSAHAEIYKWKDTNGVIRYSDIPPPSNVPHESLGSRKPVAPLPAPSAAAQKNSPAASRESDAIKRQEDAEAAKNKEQAKAAELKVKQQNCATAKANLQNYQQGGRIYNMNEKGEREYLDDAGIAKNLEQAQKEVNEYCQ